jgi:integrase
MGRKRPAGTGSIHFDEGRRRWVARLSYVDPITGERRRKAVYAASQKQVLVKLDEARNRLADEQPVSDSTMTVADWMKRWRTTSLAASSRKASTIENYATLSRQYIESGPVAAKPLAKLRPTDIERLILDLRSQLKPGKPTEDNPKPPPVRAVADSTIRSTYAVLRMALDGAVRDGLLAKNPAVLVRRPGVERAEVRHLSADEVVALLRECEDSRHYLPIKLLAVTGMRRGECLALRWTDLDLDGRVLHVRQTLNRVGGRLELTPPKTASAYRSVPLTAEMVELLRRHRADQDAERRRAANQWIETGLVFARPLGDPIDPRNVLQTVQRAAARLGLEGVGAHTLRHSVATVLLEGGIHAKLVADVLGHSDPGLTLRVYAHAAPDLQRAAIEGLSAQLGL